MLILVSDEHKQRELVVVEEFKNKYRTEAKANQAAEKVSSPIEGSRLPNYGPPHDGYWTASAWEFDIHAAILRVNKQIYEEALPILYKPVTTCKFELDSYTDLPQVFFHWKLNEHETLALGFWEHIQHFSRQYSIGRNIWWEFMRDGVPIIPEGLNPWSPIVDQRFNTPCVQMLRHITITFKWQDFYLNPGDPLHSICKSGRLLGILRTLIQEPESLGCISNRLSVHAKLGLLESLIDYLRIREREDGLQEWQLNIRETLQTTFALLKSIRKSRIVSVTEQDYRDVANPTVEKLQQKMDLEDIGWIMT